MQLFLYIILLVGSVILGGILVTFLEKTKNQRLIKLLLAFSGGFLLSIAFTHFIPELYESSDLSIGVFILVGFLIQLALEFFSGGIEHGHIHASKSPKIPWGVIIALCAHSFIEGIPLGAQQHGVEIATSHHHEHDGDLSLLLGILLHRLPVAVALMTLLTTSGIKKVTSWMILIVFALMAPAGMFVGTMHLPHVDGFDIDALLAIVVGMLLHISTTIIVETSENHKFNFLKLVTILGGTALAFLIH